MANWRVWVFVLSLFVVVACGSETIPLTGTITDAYTNKPVASAVVQVGGAKAMTDANGGFRIERWQRTGVFQVTSGDYEAVTMNFAERKLPIRSRLPIPKLTSAPAECDWGVVNDA
jgi:hypothetical protein